VRESVGVGRDLSRTGGVLVGASSTAGSTAANTRALGRKARVMCAMSRMKKRGTNSPIEQGRATAMGSCRDEGERSRGDGAGTHHSAPRMVKKPEARDKGEDKTDGCENG
jgi:hypothetical protein